MKSSVLNSSNRSLRMLAALLLPTVSVIAISISATTAHAQANFAGSEANIATLTGDYPSQFAVDPQGNVFLCDQTNNQLDQSRYINGEALTISIPFFYAGFAERARRGEPGDDVLYV